MLRIHSQPQKFGIKASCCMILWPPPSFSSVLFALALCIKVVSYAQSPHFCRIWERSWWAVLPPNFFFGEVDSWTQTHDLSPLCMVCEKYDQVNFPVAGCFSFQQLLYSLHAFLALSLYLLCEQFMMGRLDELNGDTRLFNLKLPYL